MKYLLILADGMADESIEELDGKTPLEAAITPEMDKLAKAGEIGMVATVPAGMNPGSDTANLSVIGYDPRKYYTGRSPLEAVSIGAVMKKEDVCFRMNFVTLSEEGKYEEKTIIDHSADEITTKEATELVAYIAQELKEDYLSYYKGVSYRHAVIWEKGSTQIELTPPHDILTKVIGKYLPKGKHSEKIVEMQKKSFDLLNEHPINKSRTKRGLHKANSIWIWGEGTKPELPSFEETFQKKGVMISAVDLLKGIAIAAKMKSIDVEGATGNIHTNYKGKVEAAKDAFATGSDFVYLHIEAPDECGHRGELDNKIKAIEYIDQKVIKPLHAYLASIDDTYKIAVLPDHPTPVRLRTHTNHPVPFVIYDSRVDKKNTKSYNEKNCEAKGRLISKGHEFIREFFE